MVLVDDSADQALNRGDILLALLVRGRQRVPKTELPGAPDIPQAFEDQFLLRAGKFKSEN